MSPAMIMLVLLAVVVEPELQRHVLPWSTPLALSLSGLCCCRHCHCSYLGCVRELKFQSPAPPAPALAILA